MIEQGNKIKQDKSTANIIVDNDSGAFCYIGRVMLLFALHITDHRLAFLAYA